MGLLKGGRDLLIEVTDYKGAMAWIFWRFGLKTNLKLKLSTFVVPKKRIEN